MDRQRDRRSGRRSALVSCPGSSPSKKRGNFRELARTEIVPRGRSQGARQRHNRRYGDGVQRRERPVGTIECR
jgi:hypothetical protein